MLTPFISQNVHFPLSLQHHPCRVVAYEAPVHAFWIWDSGQESTSWHLFQDTVFVITLSTVQQRQERALL